MEHERGLMEMAEKQADVTRGARRRRIGSLFWALAGFCLLLFLVKSFVADVYVLSSSSMEPTLRGPRSSGSDGGAQAGTEGARSAGEAVLVRYTHAPELRRFDLVVIERAGSDAPLVKRVAGLPGEKVQILEGDLLIDGARLTPETPWPEMIPLYDQRWAPLEGFFYFKQAPEGPWRRESDSWQLDARAVRVDSDGGLMYFHKDLRDGWMEPGGKFISGAVAANDGAVECEVFVEELPEGSQLRLRLVEEGDTFHAALLPRSDGSGAQALLTRRSSSGPEGFNLLGAVSTEFKPGCWHRVRFENRDNYLAFEVDGKRLLEAVYPANTPYGGVKPAGEKSVGPRVALGGEGLVARFRGVRVLRDLYWVPLGDYGVARPQPLGPDEYFLLGDNSSNSHDSRLWGPLRAEAIEGRPVCVAWPPSAWRVLRGAGPLPVPGR